MTKKTKFSKVMKRCTWLMKTLKISGGDALRGNTRSLLEHDG